MNIIYPQWVYFRMYTQHSTCWPGAWTWLVTWWATSPRPTTTRWPWTSPSSSPAASPPSSTWSGARRRSSRPPARARRRKSQITSLLFLKGGKYEDMKRNEWQLNIRTIKFICEYTLEMRKIFLGVHLSSFQLANPIPSENWIQWTAQECHHSLPPEMWRRRPPPPFVQKPSQRQKISTPQYHYFHGFSWGLRTSKSNQSSLC